MSQTPGGEEGSLEVRAWVKQKLRRQMQTVRNALPKEAQSRRSTQIADRILLLQEFMDANTVTGFSPLGSEVKTQAVLKEAFATGKCVALPRTCSDGIKMHIIQPHTKLVKGMFGVDEPPPNQPVVKPEEVNFVLVPALAVDPRGHRIGYGKGYYDRLLPMLLNACTCITVYDFQLVTEVPQMPSDIHADIVVTDQRVIHTHPHQARTQNHGC